MEKLFVPYKQDKPACLFVNGHKLIVLSEDERTLESIVEIDSDSFKEVIFSPSELDNVLTTIQREVSGGVIVAPQDVDPDDLIKSLQDELPWVQ